MKVLMVGNAPSVKGGITSVISQLLKNNWEKNGIEMIFIPTYIESNIINKLLFFAGAYSKMRKTLKTNKTDVVHIHMSYKGSFMRANAIHKLCKKYNVPDIIHLHGSEFQKWYDSEKKGMQKKIRAMMTECAALLVLGDKWNKIARNIEPQTNTVIVRNTISVPDETVKWKTPCQFLFMGVLIKRKGVDDLLEAIKLLKKNGGLDNYKFVIAGTGSEEQSLKQMCSYWELNSYVEFVGWADDDKKEKLFRESQIMILPSYNEGLPVAILEAISYGMPVIATNVGDISSAVKDHKNGILIKPGDIKALSKAIVEVGKQSTFEQYSKESKKTAKDVFSDELYYSQLAKLYQDCAS